MHELSLINNLLNKVNSIAQEQKAKRIVGVKVKLGSLSHISAEHFREHFYEGVAGTAAEGARLDIETSSDVNDPHAQDILLQSVEMEVANG